MEFSFAAMGALGVIALYQTGILKHVPEPRLRALDSEKVTGSAEAYSHFETPDAVVGIGSYAMTAALAAMGPPERAARQPVVSIAFAAKATFDAANALRLTIHEWSRYRKLCSWCLVASAAAFATLPLALPEAAAAMRHLLGKSARI